MFELNEKLKADTFFIADLKICRVLLMNNANYPWLILVPRKKDLVELVDLTFEEQVEVLREINLLHKILQTEFEPYKINLGALGNVVRQLHIHLIARQENDQTFPKPVWGNGDTKPYAAKEAEDLILRIKSRIEEGRVVNDVLVKKLLYRSLHRGCKETDILLGKFAQEKIHEFSAVELELYENFIEESDNEIYAWLVGSEVVPEKYFDLVGGIKNFHLGDGSC